MPNNLAYLVLFSWPILSIIAYSKTTLLKATFFTIIGGYLILPAGLTIDPPLIPPLDKSSISSLSALAGYIFYKKNSEINIISKPHYIFFILLMTMPLVTVFTNSEPYFNGRAWIQGLVAYDALSVSIQRFIYLIPLFLGYMIVKTDNDLKTIMSLIVITGVIITIPILLEVRLSPQLHNWVYDFFPHSFGQQKRFGGFRPVLFMGHGLLVAMYLIICLTAAITAVKAKIEILGLHGSIFVVVFLILILLSKTFTAYLMAIVIIFSALLSTPNVLKVSLTIATIAFFYPILSLLDLIPHESIISYVASLDTDRAQSLAFRIYHETLLLEHAKEKFLFGWGGWDRNRLWGSVTDGAWIIILGSSGFVTFIALFGSAFGGIYLAGKSIKRTLDKATHTVVAMYCLLISLMLLDQLPNASMQPYFWLIIGALYGRISNLRIQSETNNC